MCHLPLDGKALVSANSLVVCVFKPNEKSKFESKHGTSHRRICELDSASLCSRSRVRMDGVASKKTGHLWGATQRVRFANYFCPQDCSRAAIVVWSKMRTGSRATSCTVQVRIGGVFQNERAPFGCHPDGSLTLLVN